MPRDWLRRNWCDVAPSFREVERVSTLADVSMRAAVVALDKWARWKAALLQWRPHSGKWRMSGQVLPDSLRRLTTSGPRTWSLLDTLSVGSHESVELPLLWRGFDISAPAEIVKDRQRIWALVSEDVLTSSIRNLVDNEKIVVH